MRSSSQRRVSNSIVSADGLLHLEHPTFPSPSYSTMPPKVSTARQTTRRQPVRPKASTQVPTPDELADKLASNLIISNGKAKGDLSPEELEKKRISAMRTINATSQALGTIVQSGWRASKPEPQIKGPEPSTLAVEGRIALKDLRNVSPGSLNTERAASSLAGKFIALELVSASLRMCRRPA